MVTYLLDWAGLLVRWLHVIAGIAWIGASFYFVWLDNHLEPLTGVRSDPNVAGELWAVHGGGFYRSQKYRLAPEQLPPRLHWFYWEAYTTWLSGFGLLCLLYFVRAEAYLIDPSVLPLGKTAAIAIALGVLAANWLIYDLLCRSALGRSPALGAAVAALAAADAWGLCHLFGGRGAFMIFGSTLGTIMVANVLFVIIPGQRELVLAKQQGRVPEAEPGLRGKQRSVHNTYFTLPVVFVMISNHYAMTYGGHHNWLVLIAMSCAGACLRAWFVARHKPATTPGLRRALPGVLGLAVLGAVILAQGAALDGGAGHERRAIRRRRGAGARPAHRRGALPALSRHESAAAGVRRCAQRPGVRARRATVAAPAGSAAAADRPQHAARQSDADDRRRARVRCCAGSAGKGGHELSSRSDRLRPSSAACVLARRRAHRRAVRAQLRGGCGEFRTAWRCGLGDLPVRDDLSHRPSRCGT